MKIFETCLEKMSSFFMKIKTGPLNRFNKWIDSSDLSANTEEEFAAWAWFVTAAAVIGIEQIVAIGE